MAKKEGCECYKCAFDWQKFHKAFDIAFATFMQDCFDNCPQGKHTPGSHTIMDFLRFSFIKTKEQ